MTSAYDIGQYILKQRKQVGLTQKDMADKLSISPQAISKWETGETLPDTSILIDLADVLRTTTDKILTGGLLVMSKQKRINIEGIVEGLKVLENLKTYFGEKSVIYKGAIEGINQKMNIDFEAYIKDDYHKESLRAEVIIQYLMDGYTTTKNDIDTYIRTDKMRNVIYKYIGKDTPMDKMYYQEDVALFEKIRRIKPAFKNLSELNRLPGEYIRMTEGQFYWCNQIESQEDFCYGIAVDDHHIYVFEYGEGGANQRLVHQEKR